MLASPPLGSRALGSSSDPWPADADGGGGGLKRRRGGRGEEGHEGDGEREAGTFGVHPDAAGESLTPGKRVRVVAANEEDSTAGKVRGGGRGGRR